MSKENLVTKEKVFSGLIWTLGERIAAQGVSFILSVILARILLPEEYGVIAIVMVFINIANVFTNGGFGEALIQKKEATDIDFSTIFYCTLVISIIIYIALFYCAPLIAQFYNAEQIIWVLRILALKIVISSFSTIQHAYVQKHMLFKKFFFSTFGGTLISGFIGIYMATLGFGVWSLVVQYLTNSLIDIIVLLFTVSWRPRLRFSKSSALDLMNYGWKMVFANLINAIYNELRSLIIGRKYSSVDLAYYNKGNQIPSMAITNIDTAISSVVFPAMSVLESKEHIKAIGRRAMKTTSYIIFPIMIGIIVVSRPLITVLLTEKWAKCIPFMQILCVYWMTQPIQTTNWQIIKAMGRSDLCFKLELFKKSIGILLILGTMEIGVHAIAFSAAVFGIVSMFVNIMPNKRLIGYTLSEQIFDIIPALTASIIMGLVVYLFSFIPGTTIIILFIQICSGVLVYIGLSAIFKIDSYLYLYSILIKRVR